MENKVIISLDEYLDTRNKLQRYEVMFNQLENDIKEKKFPIGDPHDPYCEAGVMLSIHADCLKAFLNMVKGSFDLDIEIRHGEDE